MSEISSKDWRRGAATAYARAAEFALANGKLQVSATFANRAIKEFQELLAINPDDRKSAIALAMLLLLNGNADANLYRRSQTLLLPLAIKQSDAEVLDALVRTHLLLREFDAAHTLQLQLDAMGYQHPNYQAFLALHTEGTAL